MKESLLMPFEKFKSSYYASLGIKAECIRNGQHLMNFLHGVWPEEYKRISALDYYGEHNIDCFYKDSLIENTLKHLEEIWNQ